MQEAPMKSLMGNSPFMNPEVIFRQKNVSDFGIQQYKDMTGHKYYGTYIFGTPKCVIKDPEMAKRVLVTDFDAFVNRLGDTNQILRPLPALTRGSVPNDEAWIWQISSLKGNLWRDVRATFSPIFTGAKLKTMQPLLNRLSSNMIDYLHKHEGKSDLNALDPA